MFQEGDRVRHVKMPEWGLGEVIGWASQSAIKIYFEVGGERHLDVARAALSKVSGAASASELLDSQPWEDQLNENISSRPLCRNCSRPTTFGESALIDRVKLGWCSPFFTQDQRKVYDDRTSDVHYFDESRTIDGIPSRWTKN